MTAEEWYALDKKPGMKFRTPENKIGRLVSVHKDGATLDFTPAEGYRHVERGFYRCVQLVNSDTPLPKAKKENSKPRKYSMQRVMRVKTGVVYKTMNAAAVALHINRKTIQKSAVFGIPPKKGLCKGECFRFVD